jgi:hypothetical protein
MTCSTHVNDVKYKILVWKPKGKRPLEDLCVGGRIILEWIVEKYIGLGALAASELDKVFSGYQPR